MNGERGTPLLQRQVILVLLFLLCHFVCVALPTETETTSTHFQDTKTTSSQTIVANTTHSVSPTITKGPYIQVFIPSFFPFLCFQNCRWICDNHFFNESTCWDCNRVPTANDTIFIPPKKLLVVSTNQTVEAVEMRSVEGQFDCDVVRRGAILAITGPNVLFQVRKSLKANSSIMKISGTLAGVNPEFQVNLEAKSRVEVNEGGRLEKVKIYLSNLTVTTWTGRWTTDQVEIHNNGTMDWMPLHTSQPAETTFETARGCQIINGKTINVQMKEEEWKIQSTYEGRDDAKLYILSNTTLIWVQSTTHYTGSYVLCDRQEELCHIILASSEGSGHLKPKHRFQRQSFFCSKGNNTYIMLETSSSAHLLFDSGSHLWRLNSFSLDPTSRIDLNGSVSLRGRDYPSIHIEGKISGYTTPSNARGSAYIFASTMNNVTFISSQSMILSGSISGSLRMEVQPAVLKISEGLRIEDTVELISKNTTIDIDPNNPPNNSTGQIQIGEHSEMSLSEETDDFGSMKLYFAPGSKLMSSISGDRYGAVKSTVWRFDGQMTLTTNRRSPPLINYPYSILEGHLAGSDREIDLPYRVEGAWPGECLLSRQNYTYPSWSVTFYGIPNPTPPDHLEVVNDTSKFDWSRLTPTAQAPCNATIQSFVVQTTLEDYKSVALKEGQWNVPSDVPVCSFFRVRVSSVAEWAGNSSVTAVSSPSVWHPISVNPIGFGPKPPSVLSVKNSSVLQTLKAPTVEGKSKSLYTPCNWSVNAIELRLTSKKAQKSILVSSQSTQIFIDSLESCEQYQLDMRFQMEGDHTNGSFFSEYGGSSNITTLGSISSDTPVPAFSSIVHSSSRSALKIEAKSFTCPCGNGVRTIYQFEISGDQWNTSQESSNPVMELEREGEGMRYIARSRYVCMWERVNTTSDWSMWSDPVDTSPTYIVYLWPIICGASGGVGLILILGFIIYYWITKRKYSYFSESVEWREPTRHSLLLAAE
ncbi:hypothetical protein PROFUN_02625 [Planoprotostelium fungivorum]|uniref:Uncharacterized protein n=1 Tax=Planoprotostelium fungivorum TaxID=1890364 RepID=A0A2P6NVL0_9EUKA|nr:hypothetical protein PROFUN_02625 [Planoprotostelium fungivorum]